jgi:hypothetical protein
MTKISFSKQDPTETSSRLKLLSASKGFVTIWEKGKKDKFRYQVLKFDHDRMELVLESFDQHFNKGSLLLCSFEIRGISFFSEIIFESSISGHVVLQFKNPLYRSERRSNFRLLAYPIYEIWVEFEFENSQNNSNVIDIRNKRSQTTLFKDFLKMLNTESSLPITQKVKIRVQNLSSTGFALDVGPIELGHFKKDMIFEDLNLIFSDEVIQIPKTKIVYVVESVNSEQNSKKFRLGTHFEDLPPSTEEKISAKISKLLRNVDVNKDFENFIK